MELIATAAAVLGAPHVVWIAVGVVGLALIAYSFFVPSTKTNSEAIDALLKKALDLRSWLKYPEAPLPSEKEQRLAVIDWIFEAREIVKDAAPAFLGDLQMRVPDESGSPAPLESLEEGYESLAAISKQL